MVITLAAAAAAVGAARLGDGVSVGAVPPGAAVVGERGAQRPRRRRRLRLRRRRQPAHPHHHQHQHDADRAAGHHHHDHRDALPRRHRAHRARHPARQRRARRHRERHPLLRHDRHAHHHRHPAALLSFGARRGTTRLPGTDRGFLDKTEDPTGLLAVGARYYDPTISRFTSVDPLTNLAAPQSLAGYSYARNNPTTMSDPSGLEPRPVNGTWVGNGCANGGCGGGDSASGGANSSGGGSDGRNGGRRNSNTGKNARTNTWAPPEFVGPVDGPVIRDPANWCLVGAPAGTAGPCGPPPELAEYDSIGQAHAAIAYLVKYGGPVVDGAQDAAHGATVSVASYTRGGKHVVGYTRYRQGLGDLSKVIKADRLVVRTRWAGRASVVLQFAASSTGSWTDPEVASHGTVYRVGHAVASGAGAAAGGWAGAWAGMTGGAMLGASVSSWTGPGAAIGALIGAAVVGSAGAVGGQIVAREGYEWGVEAMP